MGLTRDAAATPADRLQKAARFDEAYFERETLEHGRGYRFEDVYSKLHPFAQVWQEMGVRTALDIGCAKGAFVRALLDHGIDALGVDVSRYAIESSPVKDRLVWMDPETEALPFPNDTFDLVSLMETVEHLELPERTLREAFRVLRPHGMLYLTTPSWKDPRDNDPTHINIRPKAEWLAVLRGMGFRALPRSRRRAFRGATFRLQLQNPSWGHAALRLGVPRFGPPGRLAIALYRTQNLLRLGHPGTQVLATK